MLLCTMLVVCFALTGCLQKKEKEDDVQVNDSSTNFPQPTVKAEADDSYKDNNFVVENGIQYESCLLYTSPSPRD